MYLYNFTKLKYFNLLFLDFIAMEYSSIDYLVKTLESRNMEIVRVIDDGSFGNIFVARNKDSKDEVAVKQYKSAYASEEYFSKEVSSN